MTLAGLRPLLALLLVASFGFRTVAPELMRGCSPESAVVHHLGGTSASSGHEHASHTTDRCECVGHSCKVSVAAPTVRAALTPVETVFATAPLTAGAAVPRTAAKHLLPFAQGPPPSRLA
jgi:hypothetical protein